MEGLLQEFKLKLLETFSTSKNKTSKTQCLQPWLHETGGNDDHKKRERQNSRIPPVFLCGIYLCFPQQGYDDCTSLMSHHHDLESLFFVFGFSTLCHYRVCTWFYILTEPTVRSSRRVLSHRSLLSVPHLDRRMLLVAMPGDSVATNWADYQPWIVQPGRLWITRFKKGFKLWFWLDTNTCEKLLLDLDWRDSRGLSAPVQAFTPLKPD